VTGAGAITTNRVLIGVYKLVFHQHDEPKGQPWMHVLLLLTIVGRDYLPLTYAC